MTVIGRLLLGVLNYAITVGLMCVLCSWWNVSVIAAIPWVILGKLSLMEVK